MTAPRVVRASKGTRMRWGNGRGVTTEIVVHPADAGLDGFGWRVSLARMVADAPFSTMPGVDRTLAVVDGEGIDLVDAAGRVRRLDRSSDPFGFPGDPATNARLVSGPVSNLNVMTRRWHWTHRAARVRVEGAVELSTSGVTVVYAAGAMVFGATTLARGDAIIVGEGTSLLRLDGRATDAIVVSLRAGQGAT